MTKTKKAVLISGGIAAVAVIVVVALAIAGVFGGKTFTPETQAIAESASSVQVFRGLGTDAEFVINSTAAVTAQNYSNYVIVSYDGDAVELKVTDYGDKKYGITAKNGFVAGNAYAINLFSGASFAAKDYEGLNSFVFTIAKPEAEVTVMNANAIHYADYSISAVKNAQDVSVIYAGNNAVGAIEYLTTNEEDGAYIITLNGADGYKQDGVLVFESKDTIIFGDSTNGSSFKIESYDIAGGNVILNVKDAELADVYSELNVNKTLELSEDIVTIDEEATINSIMNSDFVMEAGAMLFGKEWKPNDNVSIKLDFKLNDDNIGVDIILTFKNLGKNDMGSITLKVANTIAVDPSVNIQKDPTQFEFACDMNLVSKVSASFTLGKTWEDAATATQLINKLAGIAGKSIDDGKTFMKWSIPIGTLPICIDYEMGFEISFGFVGTVGVEATNTFDTTFGVVYVNKKMSGYGNYENDFDLSSLTLQGIAEAKAGITNSIGISAYGVIGVDLGVAVGAYFDLGGKFALNCDDLVAGKFTTGAAYHTEAGIYLSLKIEGKILTKEIAEKELLYKKWALWEAGYRYLPTEFVKNTITNEMNEKIDTVDEIIYLNSAYTYLTGFKAKAYDLKFNKLDDDTNFKVGEVTMDWDQFDYALLGDAANYITLDGNKITSNPDVSGSFNAQIQVTSKTNKAVTKVITVKKMPEAPTATATTATYNVDEGGDVTFDVQLNNAKFIKLITANGINAGQYALVDNTLTVKADYLSTLKAGSTQAITFESNKGNLNLFIECYSEKAVEIADNTFTFDKANPVSATFAVKTFGNTITSVDGGAQYQVSGDKLVIYGAYLNDLAVGEYTYKVYSSNNTTAEVTVTVTDSRVAELAVNAFNYNKNSGNGLNVAVSLYADTFVKLAKSGNQVSATDCTYNASKGILTIGASYMKKLATGVSQFTITTGKTVLGFTVNVSDTTNAVIFTETAKAYDKAAGGNVTFAYTKIGAGIVEVGDYEIDGRQIIFSEAFVKALTNGANVFTVNGQDLVINVTNTTAPTVKVSDLSFNKGNPVDVVIDVDLQDASFVGVDGISAADYTFANGKLTIAAAAFEAMPYGLNKLVVNTSVNAFSFSVDVYDSRVVEVGTTIYNVKTNGANDLTVDVTLYDAEVLSISGNGIRAINYRYSNGVITFANEYTFSLAAGGYSYTLKTSEGDYTFGVNIEGKLTSYDDIGNGTIANPYLIYTYAQLKSLADASKNSDFAGKYITLNSDVECDTAAITPIGNEDNKFAGTFNGNGYSIKKVAINAVADDFTGLFSYIAGNGTVKNLIVEDAKVSFSDNGAVGAGIIAGANYGTISNVKVIGGAIDATSKSWIGNTYFSVGGIAGYNAGNIDDVDVEIVINATIKGKSIIGIELSKLIFKKSYINVGAVVGYAYSGTVTNAYAEGKITATAPTNNIANNGVYGEKESTANVDGNFVIVG